MKYMVNVFDENSKIFRTLWIDHGRVRYSELPNERSGIYEVATTNFELYPGKVTIDENAVSAFIEGNGDSYIKRLLLYGYTSFVQMISLNYESELTKKLKRSRDALKTCPIDYVHAVKIPLNKLSESLARKVKMENIPIIFFQADSVDEIISTHWNSITGSMFPRKTLLVCVPSSNVKSSQKKKQMLEQWRTIVGKKRINSYFGFPSEGEEIKELLAKRIGLFPKKGSLVNGSDADYVMYQTGIRRVRNINFPDIIVLKGNVVKWGTKWDLEQSKGQELTTLIPGKFIPIEDINRYDE
ncbi:hypothetical protein ACERII_02470 [Evansella sp. AB-rgal1]|uniref:hypothetical protein n=1 Tax=Evansella sp. AB-rgal1 TaxID=3242696 RepID=UPI00359DB76E